MIPVQCSLYNNIHHIPIIATIYYNIVVTITAMPFNLLGTQGYLGEVVIRQEQESLSNLRACTCILL